MRSAPAFEHLNPRIRRSDGIHTGNGLALMIQASSLVFSLSGSNSSVNFFFRFPWSRVCFLFSSVHAGDGVMIDDLGMMQYVEHMQKQWISLDESWQQPA